MGVPYELFWKLNPKKLEPFAKKHELETKARRERDNLMAWMIGIYHQEALAAGFGKSHKYPDKPHDFFEKPKNELELFAEYAKVHAENLRRMRAQRRALEHGADPGR